MGLGGVILDAVCVGAAAFALAGFAPGILTVEAERLARDADGDLETIPAAASGVTIHTNNERAPAGAL
jgi:hypothetical protein